MYRDRSEPKLPVLRCYPKEDVQFGEDAQRAVAESRELVHRSEQLLDQVRRKLKQHYPAVRIEPRARLAAGDDANDMWYVYRDGTLVA